MKSRNSSRLKKLAVGTVAVVTLFAIGSNNSQSQQHTTFPAATHTENNPSTKTNIAPQHETVESAATVNTDSQARETKENNPSPSSQDDTTLNKQKAPTPAPEEPQSNCDPNYTPCVPIVSYDLDCPDIGFRVAVVGTDIHGFDGKDNDGLGCESY